MRRLVPVLALVLVVSVTTSAFADRRRDRQHRAHRAPVAQAGATAPAPEPDGAGAIAYSPSTGNIGWARGYADQESARAAAITYCGVADCAWQVSEYNMVAVLVLGSNGPNVGWDSTLAAAQQRALEACSTNSTGCYVARWVSR